jgi:hypothetical protein
MDKEGSDLINRSWDYLMDYYRIMSPQNMYVWFSSGEYKEERTVHLASIVNHGIYLYLPPNNEPESVNIILELEKYFKPTYGPVSYVGTSGVRVTTANNVRIGSMYIILLEKTADDWTAVSSGKLQHFGVLSQVTNSDKFSQPSRNQAIRALGESEVRIAVSYCGSEITADILDRNNNPKTHHSVLESILNADKPTNIDSVVDRRVYRIGASKPLQLVKHMCQVGGFVFRYKPHSQT